MGLNDNVAAWLGIGPHTASEYSQFLRYHIVLSSDRFFNMLVTLGVIKLKQVQPLVLLLSWLLILYGFGGRYFILALFELIQ